MNPRYLASLHDHLKHSILSGRFGSWKYEGCSDQHYVLAYTLDPEIDDIEFDDDARLDLQLKRGSIRYLFLINGKVEASGAIGVKWSGTLEDDEVLFFEAADAVLQGVEDEDKFELFKNPDLMGGRTSYTPRAKKIPLKDLAKPTDDYGSARDTQATPPAAAGVDWRQLTNDEEIAKRFKAEFTGKKPSRDDLLDLVVLAQKLKSNRLLNLAKSYRLEARSPKALVKFLLDGSISRKANLAEELWQHLYRGGALPRTWRGLPAVELLGF